jgi:hypothetical protein
LGNYTVIDAGKSVKIVFLGENIVLFDTTEDLDTDNFTSDVNVQKKQFVVGT